MAHAECPEPGCDYNAQMRRYYDDLASPLALATTRAKTNRDAHRDFDGFDVDVELTRLRRAVSEFKALIGETVGGKPAAHEVFTKSTYSSLLRAVQGPPGGPEPTEEFLKLNDLHHRLLTLSMFITEAVDNLDENLRRQGPLPAGWRSR